MVHLRRRRAAALAAVSVALEHPLAQPPPGPARRGGARRSGGSARRASQRPRSRRALYRAERPAALRAAFFAQNQTRPQARLSTSSRRSFGVADIVDPHHRPRRNTQLRLHVLLEEIDRHRSPSAASALDSARGGDLRPHASTQACRSRSTKFSAADVLGRTPQLKPQARPASRRASVRSTDPAYADEAHRSLEARSQLVLVAPPVAEPAASLLPALPGRFGSESPSWTGLTLVPLGAEPRLHLLALVVGGLVHVLLERSKDPPRSRARRPRCAGTGAP